MLDRKTAIELGPDSCLLAGVRPRPGLAEVFAVHTFGPGEWPEQDDRLADMLRGARRQLHLPRRATVVDWGLTETAAATNPAVMAALRPVRQAGFRIAEVLSPTDALARLAATHERRLQPGANVWVALNTHGAAIAIVRRSAILFSRTFNWSFTPRNQGSASQLLQRYSLVAHLAPELQRGLDQVRTSGLQVNAVITCGNLPDLRSFTMPLIQELDVEVETLDSTAGLRPVGRAVSPAFPELAPALRLVCAAVGRVPVAPKKTSVSDRAAMLVPIAGAAVVGLLLAAYGYLDQQLSSGYSRSSPQVRPTVRPPSSPPAVSAGSPQAPQAVSPPQGTGVEQSGPPAANTQAARPGTVAPGIAPPGAPLDEPIPRVDSILIDQDRRLALIRGLIVEPGDRVGSRTVVRIDRDFVVLREPSGRTVTVTLRELQGNQQ